MSAARNLGLAAFALGAAAPFAGSPYRTRGHVDVAALADIVAREADHVSALELATWIRDRKPGLRVIDVRSAAEFDAYAIPGAENVPIARIGEVRADAGEVLVLYSDGGAHAAQAWVFLQALGLRRVYFLRGGLQDWIDEVMEPTLADDASDAARATYESALALSRYFGGAPRPQDDVTTRAPSPAKPRRRGC